MPDLLTMPDTNAHGPFLDRLNQAIMFAEERLKMPPEHIDNALTRFQAAYRDYAGLPAQGRAAYVPLRGSIGEKGPADL